MTTEIVDLDDPRWVELVSSRSGALPFHHPAWVGLVRDCYRFRAFAAISSAVDGSVAGGIPLIEVRDPLRRRRWVSLPFTDHLPVLCDAGGRDELLDGLRVRAAAERVASVELRADVGAPAAATSVVGVLHELPLGPDSDAVYRRFHKSRVRASIRRAGREGVTVRTADREDDVTGTYYDLHVRTRRRLGVPVQPRRLFQLVWERIVDAGLGFVLLAEAGGSAIAGGVFLHWNGKLVYKFGASDEKHRLLQPNHALLWAAIRRGCEQGCESMDFGRSGLEDSGLRAFKDGWGATERPLVYTTLVGSPRRAAGGRAEGALRPVLRRSPLWVCRGVGAALYRYAA